MAFPAVDLRCFEAVTPHTLTLTVREVKAVIPLLWCFEYGDDPTTLAVSHVSGIDSLTEFFHIVTFEASMTRLGTHFTNGASFNHFGNCLKSKLDGITPPPLQGF